MKLPTQVTIVTNKGEMQAAVTWDLNSASYDPNLTTAQSFTVNGSITLPQGVTNPNNVSLSTQIAVSVQGLNSKIADPSANRITGIDTKNGHAAGSTINFTAEGAGMDNTNPGKGDVRFVPLNWTVTNTYSWKEAPYIGAFKITLAGDYALSVTFNRQVFDGSNWVADGQQDVKKVTFRVYNANVTPGASPSVNQKNSVQTGDDTPILMWLIILVIAAGCVAGGVIYMKKRGK